MRWSWVGLVVMTLACAGTSPQVPVSSTAASEARSDTSEPAQVELTVQAKDVEGRPLPGIRFKVRKGTEDRARAQEGTTDGDGRGQLRLPSGWYVLSAVAPGYQSFVDTDVRLARRHPKTVTMTLQPGGPVSGRVVDAAGAPVAGARLAWVPEDTTAPRLTATGGADARFTFEGVGRGRGVLLTEHRGFLKGRQVFESLPPELSVVLTAPGTLRVRGIDPSGRPLNDPYVRLERIDSQDPVDEREVLRDGVSVHEGLPPGRYRLKAWYKASDSTSWGVTSEVVVLAGQTQEVTLRFEGFQERATLRGQVVDPDGRPLANFHLMANSGDEAQGTRLSSSAVQTDAQGRFVLARLPQGPQRIQVLGFEDVLDVAADAQDVSLVFRLYRVNESKGVIEGRVLGPDGRPLTRAFRVEGCLFQDPEGRYSVPVTGGSPQALSFSAPGFASTRQRVGLVKRPRTVMPDVTLHPGRTLRGQVLRVDGHPAGEGVDVAVVAPRERVEFSTSVTLHTMTDANGRFVVEDVPREPRVLQISDDFGGTVVQPLRPDQDDVTPRLVPEAVISGTLADAEGRPLEGGRLEAHCQPGFASSFGTDAEGRFDLRVPGGQECVLTVSHAGGPSAWPLPPKRVFAPRRFVTAPGETHRVELRARSGPATLRVTLPRASEWFDVSLVEGDVPLPATMLGLEALMSDGIGPDTGEADRRPEEGVGELSLYLGRDSFEFSALPLGRYTLFVTETRAGIEVQRIPLNLSTPGVHALQSKLPEDGGALFAR